MGRWARILVGIVTGYIVMAALSGGTTALLRALFAVARSDDPPLAYMIFDLLYGVAYAGVAGWVAARVAKTRVAAYVLAGAGFVLISLTALAGWDTVHAMQYQVAAAILSPIALVIGGRLASVGKPVREPPAAAAGAGVGAEPGARS